MAHSSRSRSKAPIPEKFIAEAMSEMQCRPAVCVFCGTSMTIKVLDEHYETCDLYPIPCPYNCGQKELPRKQMRLHLNECPLCMLVCSFSELGCNFQGLERDVQRHKKEKIIQHLDLLCESYYNHKTSSDVALGKLAAYLKEKAAANAVAIKNIEKKMTELSQQINTLVEETKTSKSKNVYIAGTSEFSEDDDTTRDIHLCKEKDENESLEHDLETTKGFMAYYILASQIRSRIDVLSYLISASGFPQYTYFWL